MKMNYLDIVWNFHNLILGSNSWKRPCKLMNTVPSQHCPGCVSTTFEYRRRATDKWKSPVALYLIGWQWAGETLFANGSPSSSEHLRMEEFSTLNRWDGNILPVQGNYYHQGNSCYHWDCLTKSLAWTVGEMWRLKNLIFPLTPSS